MTEYANNLNRTSCQNIYDIIEWCHNSLPAHFKAFPWKHPELNRGIDLLASEEALNCYMSAYGDMHTSKCRAAMMNFPFKELNGAIEIVDWGCGQGIGSCTIIDILKQHNLMQWLKKVTLIEPSLQALERATCNIAKISHNSVQIEPINKFLPSKDNSSGDFLTSVGYQYTHVIHVFSNILDILNIDLVSVARLVASSHGKHFVLCIGPKNGAAYRIEQFCSVFGNQQLFSNIDSVRYGRTNRTGHPYTCMTRCFVYDGSPLDISNISIYQYAEQEIFGEYDLRLQIQNKVLTPQKARVAYRLQNLLSVDDIMYIDPVVNEVKVDFIIVRPNKGILLVNIFESNLNDCILTANNKEIKQLKANKVFQSPIDLISLCQSSIRDGIEELLMSTIENSRNFGLIKKMVICTANQLKDIQKFFNINGDIVNYTYLFGSEFITDKSISRSLFNKIGLINNNQNFDDAVKRKLASIISPSWHCYQEGRIGVEPKGVQKRLVISQCTQQKISGVAGSGKTHVLASRAINALKRTGGDILILTYNITLAKYLRVRLSEIREDFSWDKIDIYHYHQFFRIRASECHLHVEFGSYNNTAFFDNESNHKRYSAIFVDEVQDYTTEWLRIVMHNFLEPNGEFVVFGDPKQNVYHRPLDSNNDIRLGVIGGEWNKQLNTGRRFINPRLALLATSFQSSFFPTIPTDNISTENTLDNSFNYRKVTYFDLRNHYSINNLVSKLIDIIRIDNNETKDFAVLASSTKLLRQIDYNYRQITEEKTEVTFVTTEKYDRLKTIHHVSDENTANWKFKRDYEAIDRTRKQLFTTDKPCLKLSTIQSFKGWEAPSVIVILEDDNSLQTSQFRPMAPETIYTAITRAREYLYVVNIGNTTYDNFFKNQSL